MGEFTEIDEQNAYYVGAVNADNSNEQWTVQLLICATPLKSQIDT